MGYRPNVIDHDRDTKKSLRLRTGDQGRYHARKRRLVGCVRVEGGRGRNGRRGNGDTRQNEEEEEGGTTRNVASLRLVERPRELFIWRTVNEESDHEEEKEMASQEGAWLVAGGRGSKARAEKNGKVEFLTW